MSMESESKIPPAEIAEPGEAATIAVPVAEIATTETPSLPEPPTRLSAAEIPEQPSLPVIVVPPLPEPVVMPPAPEPEPEPEPEPPAPILVVSAKWSTPARTTVAAMTTRGEMWWLEPGDDRLAGITIEDPDDLDAPRIVTGAEFLALFTPAEVAALWTADPRLMAGAMKVMAQNSANLKSEEAANLIALAVKKGVLSRERAQTVLAGG